MPAKNIFLVILFPMQRREILFDLKHPVDS